MVVTPPVAYYLLYDPNKPLRLCTIFVQILEIMWAGLLVTFCNTFKHLHGNIYQIVILLTNCHSLGLSITICGFRDIIVFHFIPCLITRGSETSSCSDTIGLSCTIVHNIGPHVYTA